jgi:hypothetical protein
MPASSQARIEARRFQRRFRLLGHVRELRPVGPDVGHLMREDQMMRGVDGDLDIVAHDLSVTRTTVIQIGAPSASRHQLSGLKAAPGCSKLGEAQVKRRHDE